tara:strand:- start:5574 stop:6032 length:459 start_codon:yes stop_codon:yes gene_type:complete
MSLIGNVAIVLDNTNGVSGIDDLEIGNEVLCLYPEIPGEREALGFSQIVVEDIKRSTSAANDYGWKLTVGTGDDTTTLTTSRSQEIWDTDDVMFKPAYTFNIGDSVYIWGIGPVEVTNSHEQAIPNLSITTVSFVDDNHHSMIADGILVKSY